MDGNRTNDALTDKQVRVIPFFLEAPTIEEGCKRARVAKATFYGWLKQEAFKKELERQKDLLYRRAIESLTAGTDKAVEKLMKLLNSRNENIALRAAQSILTLAIKAKETQAAESQRAGEQKPEVQLFSLENVMAAWERDNEKHAIKRKLEVKDQSS